MADAIKLNETQQKVLEMVEKMTVLELADLVKAMEEKFGVSAVAPVATVAAVAATGAGEAVEEKSSFNVVIADVGSNKIGVIKVVRELTGVGLVEAKNLVEKGAGTVIKEEVEKAEAENMKKLLEEAGAKVELK
ncbi:MAG TPA: 50S ribosomal protein L7/L12 [Candidatus Dojkabacteria bacterium]|nr:50S ribosomal protein L7/L12 [Candidatus Dojkabacteria bacterium]HQF36040.1 50S ribosomal protein L7/L12 [Candidatus Dojkabacteria bacterium]